MSSPTPQSSFPSYLFLSRCWELNPGLTHSPNNRPVQVLATLIGKASSLAPALGTHLWLPGSGGWQTPIYPRGSSEPLAHSLGTLPWPPAPHPRCSSQCNKRAQRCSRDVLMCSHPTVGFQSPVNSIYETHHGRLSTPLSEMVHYSPLGSDPLWDWLRARRSNLRGVCL